MGRWSTLFAGLVTHKPQIVTNECCTSAQAAEEFW